MRKKKEIDRPPVKQLSHLFCFTDEETIKLRK
jgi:hypothetical protein